MDPAPAPTSSTKRILFTSLFVDILGIIVNGVAAVFTGSAIMLVQLLEGFAGLFSVGMLALGNRRASKQATKLHPFGYGKELYYWSTMAAFVIVVIVAVLAFRVGYAHFLHGEIRHAWLVGAALVLALSTNLYSLWKSLGKLLEDQPLGQAVKVFLHSPLLAPKNTVVLDAMGSLTACVGLFALLCYLATGNRTFDGVGAMSMGLMLVFTAVLLLVSVRTLIVGQGAPKELERKLRDAAREVKEVRHILGMRTMMVGSDKLLVNVEVHLRDGMNTDEVEETVARVKQAMEAAGEVEGLKVHVEPDAYEDVHRHGPGN